MKPFKFLTTNKYTPILWRKQNGREIDITSLSDLHIRNIQVCLMGLGGTVIPEIYVGRTRLEWQHIFGEELNRRR
jgi:hypothetical protein